MKRIPYQKHSATSFAAACLMLTREPTAREEVYFALLNAGANGLTDDQGCYDASMDGNTYRPRRIKLVQDGLVIPATHKGKPVLRKTKSGHMAQVWRVNKARKWRA